MTMKCCGGEWAGLPGQRGEEGFVFVFIIRCERMVGGATEPVPTPS